MKRLWVLGVALFVSAALEPNDAAHAANQIYACVNNSSGEIKLLGQDTACKNNETLVAWNVVGPAGPTGPQGPAGAGGVAAFTQFTLSTPTACCSAPINFTSNISGGGGIGGSGQLSSFVLQPGIYQVQLFANVVTGCGVVNVMLDNAPVAQLVMGSFCQFPAVSTISSVQLVTVSSPNQVLGFVVPSGSGSVGFDDGGTLILTKLQ